MIYSMIFEDKNFDIIGKNFIFDFELKTISFNKKIVGKIEEKSECKCIDETLRSGKTIRAFKCDNCKNKDSCDMLGHNADIIIMSGYCSSCGGEISKHKNKSRL